MDPAQESDNNPSTHDMAPQAPQGPPPYRCLRCFAMLLRSHDSKMDESSTPLEPSRVTRWNEGGRTEAAADLDRFGMEAGDRRIMPEIY